MKRFLFLKARDAMTRDVISVTPNMTARELWSLFKKHDFDSFPVLEGERIIGVVTKFDFLRNLIFRRTSMVPDYEDLMKRRVYEFMTSPPFTVQPEHPLNRVLELMVESRKRSFPVVDDDLNLLGIITHTDLLKHLDKPTAN